MSELSCGTQFIGRNETLDLSLNRLLPFALSHSARGRHAMEPERRRHQFQPLRALRARASRQAGPRNTTQESSKFFIYAINPAEILAFEMYVYTRGGSQLSGLRVSFFTSL